jgi:hypothetical protein
MLARYRAACAVACLFACSLWPSLAGAQVLTFRSLPAIERTLRDGGTWSCNSLGGELLSGVALGLYLRDHDIGVEVREGDWCASAAAIAALGAPRLFKSVRGHLVFHGASRPLTTAERIIMESLLQRWNVPPSVAAHIIGLRPNEAWEPDGQFLGPLLASRR